MGDFNNPNDNLNQQPNNAEQQPQYEQPQYQQPQYQQPQYQQPQYEGQSQYQQYDQYQEPPKKLSGLALASFIIGIVSLVFSCCLGGLMIIASIVGIVLGIIALTKKPYGHKNDKTFAILGIVFSSVGIVAAILLTVFSFAILEELRSSGFNYYY